MIKLYQIIFITYILIIFNEVEAQLSISLHRQQSPRELMIAKDVSEEHLKLFRSSYDNDSIALYKYLDSDFYGNLQIGHPAQNFKVIFDTAWADSWVLSKSCGYFVPACWLHSKYDSKRSSSYIENGREFDITETGGKIKGFFSVDTFKMGHINITNQTFAEVTTLPWSFLFSKVEGIVGLAFRHLSKYNYSCVFENIILENRIEKPLLSIYFNRDKTTSHAGDILLGSIDPKHYFNNTLFYVPITLPYYWQFKMDRVTLINGKKSYPYCSSGCQAAIDTSTKIIVGPSKEIADLNKRLGATKMQMNRYVIPCELIPKLPTVNFTIGNYSFKLHGSDIAQEISGMGITVCLSIFVPSDQPNSTWFLGVSFLERAYVVLDYGKQRIGFAKAK